MTFNFAHLTQIRGREYVKIIPFADAHEAFAFQATFGGLKAAADANNGAGMDEQAYAIVARAWLSTALLEMTALGFAKVPLDYREAVHDTETLLELPLTDFGEDVQGCYMDDP